jgi:hypothetical protein
MLKKERKKKKASLVAGKDSDMEVIAEKVKYAHVL